MAKGKPKRKAKAAAGAAPATATTAATARVTSHGAVSGTDVGGQEGKGLGDEDEDEDDDDDVPRFSFFGSTANVELTDSEDESDGDADLDGEGERKRARTAAITTAVAPSLPSVASLFKTDQTPSYLEKPSFVAHSEVHAFDRRAQPDAKPKRWLNKSQTVEVGQPLHQPVPATGLAAEVQQAAMMNSAAYADYVPSDAPAKVPIADLNKKKKDDGTAKKSATSFAAREKKKRDLGMSARGKSTVEEEKRLLRDYAGGSGLGFD